MHIMMIGPSPEGRGGLAQVVTDYLVSGFLNDFLISYFPTHVDGTKLQKLRFYIRHFFLIIRNLNRYKVVHIHTSWGWSFRRKLAIFTIAKLFGVKVLFHIHGSKFDTWYNDSSALQKSLIQWSLKTADIVIALSDEWKSRLLEISPYARIEVVRNGINFDQFPIYKSRSHPAPPYQVLFLGKLGQRKGVYDIIEAATILPSGRYKITLAGDGEIEKVKNLILHEKLQDMVDVPGWLMGKRKAELLEQADLFLLPSYHEGLPISILEAMASHLPVVATPVGGFLKW